MYFEYLDLDCNYSGIHFAFRSTYGNEFFVYLNADSFEIFYA
jgi:hypothetical protein